MVKLDAEGGLAVDPDFFVEFLGRAAAPGPPAGRRRVVATRTASRDGATTRRPWLTLAGLGRLSRPQPGHGLAVRGVAGMQERDRRAVLRSLLPIALGPRAVDRARRGRSCSAPRGRRAAHAAVGAAAVLLAFGIFRFVRPRAHSALDVDARHRPRADAVVLPDVDAHGAGLMVAPVLIGLEGAGRPSARTSTLGWRRSRARRCSTARRRHRAARRRRCCS